MRKAISALQMIIGLIPENEKGNPLENLFKIRKLFLIFVFTMRLNNNHTNSSPKSSKGQRLNWQPADKVTPVKLSARLTKGRKLGRRVLLQRAANSCSGNFKAVLVP